MKKNLKKKKENISFGSKLN